MALPFEHGYFTRFQSYCSLLKKKVTSTNFILFSKIHLLILQIRDCERKMQQWKGQSSWYSGAYEDLVLLYGLKSCGTDKLLYLTYSHVLHLNWVLLKFVELYISSQLRLSIVFPQQL